MDKDMDKGSGLGLDVVDRIIRNRHQGVITVSLNQAAPVAQSVYPFPEELIDSVVEQTFSISAFETSAIFIRRKP